MPTNEKRREVAARLRKCKPDHEDPSCYLREAVMGRMDCDRWRRRDGCLGCLKSTFNRLADLIEPEPERTCRWDHIEGTWFMSECGKKFDRVVPDNYCRNCGAKVVQE